MMRTLSAFIISFLSLALTLEGWAQPAGVRGREKKPDHYKLIHAGTLLAVPGKPAQTEMSILVKNDKIEKVQKGYMATDSVGAGPDDTVQLVDLKDEFVLPGLMDAHVHVSNQPMRGGGRRQRGDRDEATASQLTVNAMIYARRNLAQGFTTLRDLGSNDETVFAVRDAINRGRMIGPRILVSGSALAITGGHGDGIAMLETGDPAARLREGTCDGPVECRKAVRYQYKLGADVIKFTATGGAASNTGMAAQFFPDEVKAIIDTAHMLGVKVAAHAYEAEPIKTALRAGVDSIEHGFLLDDEAIQLMKEKGTWLVPTISASYPPPIFNIPDPPSVRQRNKYRAFERAYEAGVNIAFGSDVGTFTHGTSAKEFDMMVGFGMSEMDAIHSATVSTAKLFGLEEEIGSVEVGKLADIIAVKGNPLEDIADIHNIDFVMKSGAVAKQDGAMVEPFSY